MLPTASQYWRELLHDFDEPTTLTPLRLPRRPGATVHAASVDWDRAQAAALAAAARRVGVRAEDVVVAAWGLLLAVRAGTDDVVHGAYVDGDADGPVPVRVRPVPARLLSAHLRDTAEQYAANVRHAGVPAEQLVAASGVAEGTALFGTLVRCGTPVPDPADLVQLQVDLAGPGARLRLSAPADQLTEADVRLLLVHASQLLAAVAAAPVTARLRDVGPLSPFERHRAVRQWNATGIGREAGRCIHELFERQAARTPDAVAVLQGADRLTYAQLDAAADRLARRLAAAGVGPGDFVALHLSRTVQTVVALLGVLKAGAAYAPVDPAQPVERIRGLLRTLRVPVVLTDPAALPTVHAVTESVPGVRDVLWLGAPGAGPDGSWGLAEPPAGSAAPRRALDTDVAYVIFTSGSTGTPKGVVLTHAPVVNLIDWVNDTHGVGPADRVLFVTSLGFDLSVYDVFGVLAAGGSVRVASDAEVRDPQRLLSVLDREPITFWDSAPAALQQLEPLFALRAANPAGRLRLVFLSGDWVPLTLPGAVRDAFPGCAVVALGGATEAAIWSNAFPVGAVDPAWTSVPYGRPIDNAHYYVLDAALRPAPVGAPGDLFIGGDCLALGYHGDAELTAAKFVPDHLSGRPGARLYRTGDRARYWPDGTIEFLGRQDQQVKVRGFRIELGEVEAALAALPGVATAVAAVHGSRADAQLVAYVVPEPGVYPDPRDVREQVAALLPAYMVPAHVMTLDELPVTANGKLDRRALPEPGDDGPARPPYVAPSTAAEQAIAATWAELLQVDRVGLDDNFFDLGGHSLLITQLIARLKATLEIDVPVRAVLDHQTAGAFAAVVEAALIAELTAPTDAAVATV
ncbi:amino acid adenylation domain-containing protein [Dactylosporangium aurantiacum]|uniref:Amino acid adenylation domain-containing protein n=1 Tax=Dactylosporangium aurantiacum TaxID=35754 RepID=A0A9Q9I7C9_9ACTN|nr:non-ribosomal peptide synthetase [Dactylosporangium aurantiacum]MDG6106883.1 amino acid adenylation domain-containing protein [Dactylosporangium aurantiacum]UWZ51014.1 amino acid adenylation domain-containing protein [Dactylosporangium aurantiacum]